MGEEYENLKLENQLCFPLYACSKEIIKKYKPLLDKLDLTYTQYIVMLVLWDKRKMNVKSLGEVLFLDSGTLTPVLKKLEVKGYIQRNKALEDERNLIIEVTDQGIQLREKAKSIPNELSKCVNLTQKEATNLYKILYKILDKINEKGK